MLNLYRIAPAEETFLTRPDPPRFFASLADNFTIKGQGAVNGAAAAWNRFRKIRRELGAGSGGPAQPGLAHQIQLWAHSFERRRGSGDHNHHAGKPAQRHSGTAARLGTAVRCCVAEPPVWKFYRVGGEREGEGEYCEQKC